MNDMTSGKPLRHIILFTLPILVGNLFQQFYNIVDSVIVGRFEGVNALAAVGSTGSMVFLVFGWVMGMTSGFAILVSQSFGAQDEKRVKKYTAVSIYLCVAMTVILTVVLLLWNGRILELMNTPTEIFDDAAAYITIMYAGLFLTVAYNMLSSLLRALGDSKVPLYALIASSLVNIVLDLLLVGVFKMGVRGAGYATVFSQMISCVVCFWAVRRNYPILSLSREDFAFSFPYARQLLGMGVPMALQFSITAVGIMILQAALNAFGAIHIAAFSAAGKIQNILNIPFNSIGVAMATYVGQNMGAGKVGRIRQGVQDCLKLCLGMSVFSGIMIYFFGDWMVRGFVSDSSGQVVEAARQYFRTVIWFYPCLSMLVLYRNVLQGLGDGIFPLLGGVTELLARAVIVFLLAAPFGYAGICFADPFAWITALGPLIPVYYYRMGKMLEIEKAQQVNCVKTCCEGGDKVLSATE